MDSFIYSINSTVPIFLVMILGWVIKRLGIIDDNFASKANKYVFKVALPVLLFRDLSATDFKSQFDAKFVIYCMVVTILMFSIIWILTEIFMKDESMKGAFVQASFRSSAAILGMAFIQSMYSSTGMAPLMIVAAVPLFNIFSVIVLTFKAVPENADGKAAEKDSASNIKKACINIARNPIIIGIVLGFLASVAGLKQPVIMQKTIQSVAQTATPVALICIGAGFEGSYKEDKTYAYSNIYQIGRDSGHSYTGGSYDGIQKSGTCRNSYNDCLSINSNMLYNGKEYG